MAARVAWLRRNNLCPRLAAQHRCCEKQDAKPCLLLQAHPRSGSGPVWGFGDHSLQGGVLETAALPVAGQTGALHTCVAGWWPAGRSSWPVSADAADWLAGMAGAGNH